EAGIGDCPAIASGILHLLAHMGRIDEELLGYAAADDTSPADTILLRDSDAGPIARGHAGRPHAPRAGADDEEIEGKAGHQALLRGRRGRTAGHAPGAPKLEPQGRRSRRRRPPAR